MPRENKIFLFIIIGLILFWLSVPGEEQLEGGDADYLEDDEFDPKYLKIGTDIEMEHTDDASEAKEIAKDHLAEDPLYYEKLALVHQ